jgi:hypothetical protein
MKEFNLKLIVQAIDKVSGPARRMGQALGRMAKKSGLDKLGGSAKLLGKRLAKAGKEAAKFGSWLAAGFAAAGAALFGLVRSSAGVADQLAKTADRLGVGIEELQRMRFAAEKAGVAQNTFDTALQRFTRRSAEAAKGTGVAAGAMKALGIQLTDANGNLRPSSVLLGEVSDKMAQIEDPAKRVRLAFALFDSDGVKMINMLKDGAKAMEASGREAEKLGMITEEQARASEEFNDNMTRLTKVVTKLGHMLANELMPYFNEFVIYLKDLAVASKPAFLLGLKQAFHDLGTVVEMLKNGWSFMTEKLSNFQKLILATIPALSPFARVIASLVSEFGSARIVVGVLSTAIGLKFLSSILGLFGPLKSLIFALGTVAFKMTVVAYTGVKALIVGFVKMLPMMGSVIAATWSWTAALLANPLTWVVAGVLVAVAAVAGAAYLVYQNWDKIAAFFSGLWADVKAAFDQGFIQGIAHILETFNPALLIAKGINGLIDYLFGINMQEIGSKWIGGLADGITSAWGELTAWLADAVTGLLNWMPDWVKDQLGLSGGMSGTFAAPAPPVFAPAQPSAIQSGQNQIGGAIKVKFENMPANARITDVKSDTKGFGINVDAGYSMAGT